MMIRLDVSRAPRWIEILPGVRVRVTPVTTGLMISARAAVPAAPGASGEAGAAEGVPVVDAQAAGFAMTKAVARQVILEWEGVGDSEGNPAPVTPEGIDALMDVWPAFQAFQEKCLGQYLLVEQEKNASAPSPNGTSAGATDTAPHAPGSAGSARAS